MGASGGGRIRQEGEGEGGGGWENSGRRTSHVRDGSADQGREREEGERCARALGDRSIGGLGESARAYALMGVAFRGWRPRAVGGLKKSLNIV